MRRIARNAAALLKLDDCALALLDDAGSHLVVLAAARDVEGDEYFSFPLHDGPLAVLTERPEVLTLRGVRLNARLRPLADEATCILICLPLLLCEELLGVLLAGLPEHQDTLLPEQMRLLTLLAEQAALAVQNARQAELVRDASRVKTKFLSLVSHELRAPLNTINGYLDLLLDGIAGEINEQQQEFLRRARSSSEHLYALLEDLLLAARADAGQLRLQLAPVSLRTLVAAALEELEVTALDNEVALTVDLPADLPDLLVDGVRLQQVLRNVLNNALHFTPAGGRITVSARVLAARDGARSLVEVRVSDTGVGIAPEYHQRIFERFFQVPPSAGGRTGGQGLGLAIVKMIVELHGGQVRVESTPGAGSIFILTLDALRR